MFSNILFIILLPIICVNISHGQECSCLFSECSIEKVDVVNRLMALALEVQTSISQSNSRCRADNSNNMTSTTTTTISTTTEEITTPETTPETTTLTICYCASVGSCHCTGKYLIPGELNGLYTREEAISLCSSYKMNLVAIDESNEWAKLKEYLEIYAQYGSSTFWTAGEKTCSVSSYSDYSCFKWNIGGSLVPIDFSTFTQQVNVVDDNVMLLQVSRIENPPSINQFFISRNTGSTTKATALCENLPSL